MDSRPEQQVEASGELWTRGVSGAETDSDVLREAGDAVRDREKHYGHPELDFTAQAAAISAYLHRRFVRRTSPENRGGEGEGIWQVSQSLVQREDIPAIMLLVKVMRWAQDRTRDNMVDVAGYAKAAERAIGRDGDG